MLKLIYLANPTDNNFTIESFDSKFKLGARIIRLGGKIGGMPVCTELIESGILVIDKFIVQEVPDHVCSKDNNADS